MQTLYLSGAIKSDPNWKQKFKAAELKYAKEYLVISPRVIYEYISKLYTDKKEIERECFKTEILYLFKSDLILMLDGKNYVKSDGCVIEHKIAEYLKLPIFYGELK